MRRLLPDSSPWDVLLVAVLCATSVFEGVVRDDLSWPLFTTAFAVFSIAATLWRHRYPVSVVVIVFGSQMVLRLIATANGVAWDAPWSMVVVLVLPYALLARARPWGVALGLTVILLFPARIALRGSVPRATAATVLLMTPALLGAARRFRAYRDRIERERARFEEREALAREIHDTVAHRLAAIAIQVQAARAEQATSPEDTRVKGQNPAAPDTLDVIEEQATRALAEMRTIVKSLRAHDDAPVEPLPQLNELTTLGAGIELPVNVELAGPVAALEPSLQTTVYRIVRESVTNAIRHALEPSEVRVCVMADQQRVTVEIRDDGREQTGPHSPGFGLTGMAERAQIWGGTFEAGPAPAGGWSVRAVLPRKAAS
ncbi:MAG: histidine kinase [Myxococcota bacterium]